MKVFVALLVLVACAVAEEWTPKTGEEIKEIRSECLKEHPLTAEEINRMKNFESPNEEAVRQYILCAAKKMGIFCPHAGYHPERVAKQFKLGLDEAVVLKLVEDCIEKYPKGDKSNDVAAFEVHNCIMGTGIGDQVKEYIKKHNEAHE